MTWLGQENPKRLGKFGIFSQSRKGNIAKIMYKGSRLFTKKSRPPKQPVKYGKRNLKLTNYLRFCNDFCESPCTHQETSQCILVVCQFSAAETRKLIVTRTLLYNYSTYTYVYNTHIYRVYGIPTRERINVYNT